MTDQRRLHVASVCIEFEFAFVAIPEDASEVACSLIDLAAKELSSLHDFAIIKVRESAPAYELPLGGCDDDAVTNLKPSAVRWCDAVANDKRLRAKVAP